jgi:hypothetical protein
MGTESYKWRIRLVSAGVGALIFLVALLLEATFPDKVIGVQVIIWSLIVLTTTILINHRHYRQRWFWIGICICVLLHALILRNSQKSLPFTGLGVVILIGYAEGALFQIVFQFLSTISFLRSAD